MEGEFMKELARLNELNARQTTILERLDKLMEDHEKRIRAIERIMAYGLGASAFAKLLWDFLHK